MQVRLIVCGHITPAKNAERILQVSFPKIISGCIGDAAQPRSEWRQWRQIVGLLDALLPTVGEAFAMCARKRV